jgi:hypothetical protein
MGKEDNWVAEKQVDKLRADLAAAHAENAELRERLNREVVVAEGVLRGELPGDGKLFVEGDSHIVVIDGRLDGVKGGQHVQVIVVRKL